MTLADTASATMYFEQFYLGCLAHASYLLGSDGEAVVVDPQRDVEIYLQAAQEHGLNIRHIFETHLHADFVSGHKELAARTGATIYIGAQAGATFPHVALTDGVGKLRRYKIVDPSFHNWIGLALALRRQAISDFPLCNKSFNLSYCGFDL